MSHTDERESEDTGGGAPPFPFTSHWCSLALVASYLRQCMLTTVRYVDDDTTLFRYSAERASMLLAAIEQIKTATGDDDDDDNDGGGGGGGGGSGGGLMCT